MPYFAILIWLILTGCSIEYHPNLFDYAVMPDYSVTELQMVNTAPQIRIKVYGKPFPASPNAASDQIAAAMNDADAIKGRFGASASDDESFVYHVVWDFSPASGSVSPNRLCRMSHENVRPFQIGEPIRAHAALCKGAEALTAIRGDIYYVEGPTAPAFNDLIAKMTVRLFPKKPQANRSSGDERLSDRPHPVGGR